MARRPTTMRAFAMVFFGIVLTLGFTAAWAVPVDLELVLAVDVSGSVSADDFILQSAGYEAAFRNAGIISQIENGSAGAIAVTLVQWSSGAAQAIPWTLIDSAATANAFADSIAGMARLFSDTTGMTNALNFSSGLLNADNGFEGTREVIDLSGDGAETDVCSFFAVVCVPLQNARDAFLAGGDNRAINALWISDPPFFGGPGDSVDALAYGSTNVIGGSGPFQTLVSGFDDLEAAISVKISREITPGVPGPATLVLLAIGVVAIGVARRRT